MGEEAVEVDDRDSGAGSGGGDREFCGMGLVLPPMFAVVSNGLSDLHSHYQICTCYLVLVTKFVHFAIVCVLLSACY